MNAIKKTSNYSQFKYFKTNRNIREAFVLTLKRSIQKKNLLHLNPIIVNEKMEIIDGQHRLKAAQDLNLPIYYLVDEGLGFEDILLLNANVVKWSTHEYLEAYIKLGLKGYLDLKKFCNKHNLSITNGAAVLTLEKENVSLRAPYSLFKEGSFEIKNEALSEKFMLFVKKANPFLLENVFSDRDYLRGMWQIYSNDDIDKDILLKKLARYPRKIYRAVTSRGYLRQLEDAYNYQARGQLGVKQQARFF